MQDATRSPPVRKVTDEPCARLRETTWQTICCNARSRPTDDFPEPDALLTSAALSVWKNPTSSRECRCRRSRTVVADLGRLVALPVVWSMNTISMESISHVTLNVSYGIALIGTDDLAGRRIENAMRKLKNLRKMLEHSPKKEGS